MPGPINNAASMLENLRKTDPFAAANIDRFNKEQERKREFLDYMMRKLSPEDWAALGPMITEAVIKAPGANLDQAFAEIEKMVDTYLRGRARGAETVHAALDVVEKFLGSAAPKDKEA